MELHEIVMKLVGPVRPVGETNADSQRLENLVRLTALVGRLIDDIDDIASRCKNSREASVRTAGEHCVKFMNGLQRV